MKTFRVSLSKAYLVIIKAENEQLARLVSEFFTSDITDLSDEADRAEHKFSIKEIDCVVNDAIDCEEIEYYEYDK